MKRILTLLMAVSLLLCLAACGQPADHAPEQPPQQAEPSEPPAQTEPPALEGEALSVLPAEDAGLTEGGYDAYREADPMAEIVLLPTRSVTDFHYFIVGFREDSELLTLTREDDLYTADALSPGRPLLLAIPFVETIPNRGISYVDADGALRQYAIVESEKDGTIFLMEEAFEKNKKRLAFFDTGDIRVILSSLRYNKDTKKVDDVNIDFILIK